MAVCDICKRTVDWQDAYVLSTREVATSETYWENTLNGPLSRLREIDPEGSLLAALALQQAAQQSGWLVCEACSVMFAFDREKARAYARERNSNPPGYASAPVESVANAATAAWEKLCAEPATSPA